MKSCLFALLLLLGWRCHSQDIHLLPLGADSFHLVSSTACLMFTKAVSTTCFLTESQITNFPRAGDQYPKNKPGLCNQLKFSVVITAVTQGSVSSPWGGGWCLSCRTEKILFQGAPGGSNDAQTHSLLRPQIQKCISSGDTLTDICRIVTGSQGSLQPSQVGITN